MHHLNLHEPLAANPALWDRLVEERPGSILLKTARPDAENTQSHLFLDPSHILTARDLSEIPFLFARIDEALASGFHVAGFLSYEAGYHFEPAALGPNRKLPASDLPLAWFGVYRDPLALPASPYDEFPSDDQPPIGPEDLSIDLPPSELYRDRIRQIHRYIEAGDFYQANLTLDVRIPWRAAAHRLFRRMLANQPVAYGAFIHAGDTKILSASPELFFRRDGSQITVRPMKGTVRRGRDSTEDAALATWLSHDPKNRSENVMIVDLLRNDLGRISAHGSVQVTDLFSIERYNQLFQMTSTIRGELQPGITNYQLFRSLFPCGSITGAPKVRTMQVLRELESGPRGIGCGAIGFFAPGNRATFSVAIRTLTLRDSEINLRVGSGITYDSDPEAEYQECRLKSRFITDVPVPFDLIETLLWNGTYAFLDQHLERLAASAGYFDFRFDREEILHALNRYSESLSPTKQFRVRILLSRSGAASLTSQPLALSCDPISLLVSSTPTDSSDCFLRHKTTHRPLYDRMHRQARASGFDDALFLNEHGQVTECSIYNVMIEKDGRLLTPPVACGLLPGVYRSHLLAAESKIQEQPLSVPDILAADHVFAFNSVRGLRSVSSIRHANEVQTFAVCDCGHIARSDDRLS